MMCTFKKSFGSYKYTNKKYTTRIIFHIIVVWCHVNLKLSYENICNKIFI